VFYNQPKFCPNATWNPNGETFANISIKGPYPRSIFVDSNNYVYVSYVDSPEYVSVWSNDSIIPRRNISGNKNATKSLFVTLGGDIYIDNGTNGCIDKWTLNNTRSSIEIENVNHSCFGLFIDTNDTLYCSVHDKHEVIKRSLIYDNSTWISAAGDGTAGSTTLFNCWCST